MKERVKLVLKVIGIPILLIVLNYFAVVLIHKQYQCPIYHTFNISCPGCGGTRMVKYLLKGDIYHSFMSNQYLFITLPIIIPYTIVNIIRYINSGKFHKAFNKVIIIFAILLILFGIIRNIPSLEILNPNVK